MAYSWPLLQEGDRFLVTLVGNCCAQTIMNTSFWRAKTVTGNPTIGTVCQDLIDTLQVANSFIAKYLDCMPGNYTMTEVWCQKVSGIRYAKVTEVVNQAGTSGEPADTANVAQTLTRRSVNASRRGVSNMHLLSPTSNQWIEEGQLTAQAKTALQAFADKGILEYTLPGPGPIMQPVTQYGLGSTEYSLLQGNDIQETVRIMRRRTVRVGI